MQVQVAILISVWLLFLPLVYRNIKFRITKGRGTFRMVLLALALVTVPLLPTPESAREYALLLYIPWVVGFSIACLLLVSTRRVIAQRSPGHGLPRSRFDVAPIIGKVVANITKYIVIVTWGLSTLIYSLAMVTGLYNPFGAPFSIADSVLFHINQALKGMLSDLVAVFEWNVQTKLHLIASDHPIYAGALVVYRLFCSTVVIGAISLMFVRYVGKKKDEPGAY